MKSARQLSPLRGKQTPVAAGMPRGFARTTVGAGSHGRPAPGIGGLAHSFARIEVLPPASLEPGPVQRFDIPAKKGDLEANLERKKWVDMYYGMLNSQVMLGKYGIQPASSASGDMTIIRYSDSQSISLHQLLSEVFTNSYGNGDPAFQLAVRQELQARYYVSESVGSIELTEEADIGAKMSSLMACVITSLMYAEGGPPVLGASTVEELHQTLQTRFPESWAQYSDDAVIASLYGYFGYREETASGKAKTAVPATGYARGTFSTGGHMVGFKKDNGTYSFRDNEGGETDSDSHKYSSTAIVAIWTK